MVTLADLNAMDSNLFVKTLGAIFEDSPQVAAAVAQHRPFTSTADLHTQMVAEIQAWTEEEQQQLIAAHPDLGSRVAMAPASVAEQTGAGLDRLSAEQLSRFQQLNQTYRQRFGFPYVVAVKNHTPESILADYAQRIHNSPETEHQRALQEIFQIARFRLQALITLAD
ncbi:MAG: hypothetical protein OHK0012_03370 [Synechococcales cyanobacterium]